MEQQPAGKANLEKNYPLFKTAQEYERISAFEQKSDCSSL
jgi:hypothetical protein